MNAEHDEAAEIDRIIGPKLDELKAHGGVIMGRRFTINEDGGLVLGYVVVMPLAVNQVELQLLVAPLP
jgi:hypothetical protein